MPCQVPRRGDDNLPGRADKASSQGAVGEGAEADGDVGLAAEDVYDFVAEHQVDDDGGVAGAEGGDQGDDGHAAVGQCGADAQAAAGRALVGDGVFDFGHVGEDAPGAAQVGFAFGGEGDGAGGAQQ
ncbi:hypothetical protein PFL603g_04010 [Pseudomonas fluorescens]|uniref:Uncharacterized protein n=1 Tax=Pseudomonas fluorescens TaxID=294 RepID=A0A109KPP0_PSEFL|nr:hypothetical protein PFL603g_04010 [Pseudomonas fluorescens]